MRNIFTVLTVLFIACSCFGQTKRIALYDLVKRFIQDSTGRSSFGDWGVGRRAAYPVRWQTDRLEISEDAKINFYRRGTANATIDGMDIKWTVMLRGSRSGFSSFNISGLHKNIRPLLTIDSLFGKKPFSFALLQSCYSNPGSGFYYYQVKMPKKVIAYLKVAWLCKNENCLLSLDCYDELSKQFASFACPNR